MPTQWWRKLPGIGHSDNEAGRSGRPTIYLHIGAMKTGTTYLQDLMTANRDELAAAGYLFPGERWSDQSRAVREMLFRANPDARLQRQTEGSWDRLRDEMLAHRGRASIVSMEFLSFADTERATRIIESLERADVHVILTIRDARTAIPAQWQTACRNGAKLPLRRFLRGVRHVIEGTEGRGARMFDRTQGIPRMLEVWAPLVGPERMHVITVPPKGSDPALLWHRFAEVIGVHPDVIVAHPEASNTSLGYASSEFLRLVNKELGPVPTVDYWRVVKGGLARTVLGERAGIEPHLRLNRRGLRLANRWNRRMRRAIEQSGVQFYGSFAELPSPEPSEGTPSELPTPSVDELLATAAHARRGMAQRREELAERADARLAGDEADTVPASEGPLIVSPDTDDSVPGHWLLADDPVATAVREVVAQVRECIELNQLVTTGGLMSAEEQDEADDLADDLADEFADEDDEDEDTTDGPDDEDNDDREGAPVSR